MSTFDVRFPRWLEYVWCYGTIHIPHHVAPAMPWYNLQKAARAIRQAYPNYYQERRFRRPIFAMAVANPVSREDRGPELFRPRGFAERVGGFVTVRRRRPSFRRFPRLERFPGITQERRPKKQP